MYLYAERLTKKQWAYLLPAIPKKIGSRCVDKNTTEYYCYGTSDDHKDIKSRLIGLTW